MKDNLFKEFNSVSSKQWKQKIQFDLNGLDYNETLVSKTLEGIAIKPFYHADTANPNPNSYPTKATAWNICQSIFVSDPKKSNLNAIHAIKNGADSITFIIPNETISIKDLIININTGEVLFYFELLFLSEPYTNKIQKHIPGAKIHLDIIGHLAKTGNWFKNLNNDFSSFDKIIKSTGSFTINMGLFQNAGANSIQQIGYALAQANEYLVFLENNKTLPKSIEVIFKTTVGSNYFFEIAKLRALRRLWDILVSEYNITSNCHIFTTPTIRNKSLYDNPNNIIRTTTECMSAILGGANTICNLAYDFISKKNNKFGERIAKNQLLLLKYESYFNKVNNPADGSYYIEEITNEISEKSLDLLKNVEANGGFLKQLKLGTIQRKIKESARKEEQQFKKEEIIILGANKYLNDKESLKNELEIYPFLKKSKRKTLLEPIIEYRLSENLEQKRLKNES